MEVNNQVWKVLLCAATFTLTACNRYSAESTEGWVIDADTKKPIEGVIVVANWQLHKSTMGGKRPADHLNIMETMTDNDGLFYFEGWEKKLRCGDSLLIAIRNYCSTKKDMNTAALKTPNVQKMTPVKFVNQPGTEKR